MERIINFSGKVGRYDIPSFLFTENDPLELIFNVHTTAIGKYVVTLNCGDQKHVLTLAEDMKVIVPPGFIERGNLNPLAILLELRTMKGDKVIIPSDPKQGGFFIEPLYIETVEENTFAVAWCQELERRLKNVETKLKEFEDKGVPLVFEE